MRIKVLALSSFRHILGKESEVEMEAGATVSDLLEKLCAARVELRPLLFEQSALREDVNILIQGKNIASLQGLGTRLSAGDTIAIFPAAIGG